MRLSDLKHYLSEYDNDAEVTFYFLKNDTLTNCQLENIGNYGMGIEFTIQDTSEHQEAEYWHYVNNVVTLMIMKLKMMTAFLIQVSAPNVEKVINQTCISIGMGILKKIMTWASMSAYAKFASI